MNSSDEVRQIMKSCCILAFFGGVASAGPLSDLLLTSRHARRKPACSEGFTLHASGVCVQPVTVPARPICEQAEYVPGFGCPVTTPLIIQCPPGSRQQLDEEICHVYESSRAHRRCPEGYTAYDDHCGKDVTNEEYYCPVPGWRLDGKVCRFEQVEEPSSVTSCPPSTVAANGACWHPPEYYDCTDEVAAGLIPHNPRKSRKKDRQLSRTYVTEAELSSSFALIDVGKASIVVADTNAPSQVMLPPHTTAADIRNLVDAIRKVPSVHTEEVKAAKKALPILDQVGQQLEAAEWLGDNRPLKTAPSHNVALPRSVQGIPTYTLSPLAKPSANAVLVTPEDGWDYSDDGMDLLEYSQEYTWDDQFYDEENASYDGFGVAPFQSDDWPEELTQYIVDTELKYELPRMPASSLGHQSSSSGRGEPTLLTTTEAPRKALTFKELQNRIAAAATSTTTTTTTTVAPLELVSVVQKVCRRSTQEPPTVHRVCREGFVLSGNLCRKHETQAARVRCRSRAGEGGSQRSPGSSACPAKHLTVPGELYCESGELVEETGMCESHVTFVAEITCPPGTEWVEDEDVCEGFLAPTAWSCPMGTELQGENCVGWRVENATAAATVADEEAFRRAEEDTPPSRSRRLPGNKPHSSSSSSPNPSSSSPLEQPLRGRRTQKVSGASPG